MKKILHVLFDRYLILVMLIAFTGTTFAYTPPTALRVLWTGADQSATCHQYGDYITNVTFAGINNTTTVGTYGWHFDYGRTTPQVTPGEVTIGQSYSISVTVTGQDLSFQYVAVYVDWNQNNVNGTVLPYQLDANENPVVWYGYTGTGSKTLTGTITVPSGISPGQIYMRVMLDADTGNSNGGDFTCAIGFGEFEDYVLNVNAAAVPPTTTTGSAGSISATGATLNGTINANNISTAVTFEYGTTTGYGTNVTADQSPVTGSTVTSVSKAITGLTPNTTYHFKVKGVSTGGSGNGTDQTFTTAAVVPVATTAAATSVTTSGATLNGSINANNASTTASFDYGTTISYGTSVTATQSPVTGTSATAVSYVLSGLVPNTTYHFRVNGVNTAGTTNGSDLTFTTTAAVSYATTAAATSVTTTGAILNGSINANNASTTVTFDYGTTTSYGTNVTATQSPVTGTSATPVSYVLSGLVPNTTYHFRVNGVNTAGTTNGSDLTFTTTAAVPAASTTAASSVTTTGTTLNGSINANNASTTVTFDYGTTTSYGSNVTATQSPVTGTWATPVSYVLSGLVPNTTYHFRVNGVNTAGTTNGSDLTFTTTAAVPYATTAAATSVTNTGTTLNGSINANNASTTVTFDYGTTTSYGSNVTATESPVTGTSATPVSYVLSSLVPNTTYHFRVNGVNTAGTTNGSDLTFTTTAFPDATTSAATDITTTGATLNGGINANNYSTTVTFDYGTGTSYDHTGIAATPGTVTGTLTTPVNCILSGLIPNMTYHYRVNGLSSTGTVNGTDGSFTTTASTASTFETTGNYSSAGNWSDGIPSSSTDVTISAFCTVDGSYPLKSLTINPGNAVTIASGNNLSASGDFSIKSDALNGTATLINYGSLIVGGMTNVEQYLTGGSVKTDHQWWYIASPLTGATSGVITQGNQNNLGYYDESANPAAFIQITGNAEPLIDGRGYYAQLKNTGTYIFNGGTLNNGDITITSTRSGTTNEKRGFNLVGNPYPSYLNWDLAYQSATNIRPTIWYRTYTGGGDIGNGMEFETYNSALGIAIPATLNNFIPPVQGFWVRVNNDGTGAEPIQSTGMIYLTNAMLSHAGTVDNPSTNRLKSPEASIEQIIRLTVTNGENSDETVIATNVNALDSYDIYDSEKMSNNNVDIPEIYTLAGSEQLSINGLNSITDSKEVVLGIQPGQAGNFKIEATEISNLESNMNVILIDKLTGIDKVLTVGAPYSFSTDALKTNDRFIIRFKSGSIYTGADIANDNGNVLIFFNLHNRITVTCNDRNFNATSVSIYNVAGQKLWQQKLTNATTEINSVFIPGIYMVTVNTGDQIVTRKMIFK